MEPAIRHGRILGSSDEQQPVKGILKKTTNPQPQPDENAPRLKWDEENLTITEAQKDSTMKIDEPKTPFVYYNHDLDTVMDPEEVFSLDGTKKTSTALAHTPPVPSYFSGLDHKDDDDEEENDDDDDNRNKKNNKGNINNNSDDDDDDDDDDNGRDEWQDSDDDEDSDHESSKTSSADHDKFARLRAEHYKMKEAIQLGHHLLEDEEDEDDEDSNDKNDVDDQEQELSLTQQGGSRLGPSSSGRKIKDDDDDESLDMEL